MVEPSFRMISAACSMRWMTISIPSTEPVPARAALYRGGGRSKKHRPDAGGTSRGRTADHENHPRLPTRSPLRPDRAGHLDLAAPHRTRRPPACAAGASLDLPTGKAIHPPRLLRPPESGSALESGVTPCRETFHVKHRDGHGKDQPRGIGPGAQGRCRAPTSGHRRDRAGDRFEDCPKKETEWQQNRPRDRYVVAETETKGLCSVREERDG